MLHQWRALLRLQLLPKIMFYVAIYLLFFNDIRDLGADSFEVRTKAEERLQEYSWLAWPVLDFPFADLERRKRAERIVSVEIRLKNPPMLLFWSSKYRFKRDDMKNAYAVMVPFWIYRHVPSSAKLWDEDFIYVEYLREITAKLYCTMRRLGVPKPVLTFLVGLLKKRENVALQK
jgi:hypothetical protein